ncbi:uncharacterized protein LOC132281367 [Cornus florida]|uniref:uncharacterized protein LOC132281367 n=1 Tax=Cornus florida TaxID=4283 RepID=UPI0028A1FDA8|nr:uncharacterized protein LOC132281367 [Cornus florida]
MEASEIADCHPATAIETFKLAMIQGTKFYTSLVKYSPPDMQTLNARAQIYIRLKENIAHRAQHATLVTVENKPRERVPTPKIQKSQRSSTPVTHAPEKKQRVEEGFTPLRTTSARLFQENKTKFTTPQPIKSLRRQVENMIARGELTDYLMTKEYTKPCEVYPSKVKGTQVKVIHAIHGKSEDDQESREVYRSRLRATHKLRKISSVNAINLGSISIGFGDGDLSRVQLPHEDPLVISILVANCMIRRVLVDPGSSTNIITKTVFDQLEIPSSSIRPTSSPLMGFNGTRVDPLGVIDLSITTAKMTLKENFVLTEIHHSYNLIMGRGWIHRMRGVPSLHQVMRCLSLDGKEVINLWGDQVAANECYMLTLVEAKRVSTQQQPEEEEEIAKPTKETLEAVEVILGDPQKVTYLGSSSTSEENEALIEVIQSNTDAFTWDHSDIVGIDPLVSCHSLKVDLEFKPVKQKHRRFTLKRNHIIAEEVSKLLQAGFIREVQYPQWLSNVVVV